MEPIINIVIPVYGVEKYIEKCVESVICQTYRNWRILLVDDESRDSCPMICDNLAQTDSRIISLHKKNGGLADTRNFGLNYVINQFYLSTSDNKESNLCNDYVMFLDSDDYLALDCLQTLVNTALKYDAQIVNMAYASVDECGNILYAGSSNTNKCNIYSSCQFLHMMCYKMKSESACTKLYRLDCIKDYRFEAGVLNEDFLFNSILCFQKFSVVDLDYSGYYYLQRLGSISHSGANKSYFDSIRNPIKLMKQAKRLNRSNLIPDFARVALYQIRCISFVLSYNIIWGKSKDFFDLLASLRYAMPYISQCNLPSGYVTTLKFINTCPRIACTILTTLFSLKNKIIKK